jgi:hypothetical protein
MSGVDISAECCQRGAVSFVLLQLQFFCFLQKKVCERKKERFVGKVSIKLREAINLWECVILRSRFVNNEQHNKKGS